jgi:branched-subunit amino acid aminotransferase/4-amino-4-deoxychorismate lyase
MSDLIVYRDGRYIPQSQAGLSLHDAGFLQGVTVTDRARTFRGKPFRLVEHLARFRQSCQFARVPLSISDDDFFTATERVLQENRSIFPAGTEMSLIFFATPGEAREGQGTLGIQAVPLQLAGFRHLVTFGATLLIPRFSQVPAEVIDRRIKHRSRLHWWLAEQEVRERDPHAIALLADADGTLTETATSNFLLVRDGVVFAPPPEQVLGGITLGVVEEVCVQRGIPFRRQPLRPEECRQASEALLTCTSFCLAPVARVEDHEFSQERRPIFEAILAGWTDLVGIDPREQILAH